MKKQIIILVLVTLFASITAFAQEKGDGRLFVSMAAGTKAALNNNGESTLGLGVSLTDDYFLFNKFALVTSYTYFFPSTEILSTGQEISIDANALNIDVKYYLLANGIDLYGLFGISFASATASPTDLVGFATEEKVNKTGYNAGAGIDFHLGENYC